jgi:hypothetical protein
VRIPIIFILTVVASLQTLSQHLAGFDPRWAAQMNPEDPLVLEWLKDLQDHSSADHCLLPAQEGDGAAQTFNNAMVALAFIVKGERERAERILDFYDRATVPDNTDSTLQNFFYKGEPRGFFQEVSLATLHNVGHGNDRWMGDMAWLLCAYKNYEYRYQSLRYRHIVTLLRDLLVSYYTPASHGGYIRHGWRKGDAYKHEADGHHEGNIDCFAVLRLCGEDSLAMNIRAWIDNALGGLRDLPLDLYTWRTLAYGPAAAPLLDLPERDSRYRKTITLRGRHVTGFFHGPDPGQQNIWTDGLGHMACAYVTCGDRGKGAYYVNQMDSMMLERSIGGACTHALPYTATRSGGYDWVDTLKGFTSCAAWYILARNCVNPFRPDGALRNGMLVVKDDNLGTLQPPEQSADGKSVDIRYAFNVQCDATLELSATTLEKPLVLFTGVQPAGVHTFHLDTSSFASGVYIITLRSGDIPLVQPLIILREDTPAY